MVKAELFNIQYFSVPYRKIFDCRQVWSVLFFYYKSPCAILAPRSVFALPRLLGMVVRLAAWEFRKGIADATFSKLYVIKERHHEISTF
nr:hypothetical protein [uncultured Acetatifactor sp.]